MATYTGELLVAGTGSTTVSTGERVGLRGDRVGMGRARPGDSSHASLCFPTCLECPLIRLL